jgi:hypothetical protein
LGEDAKVSNFGAGQPQPDISAREGGPKTFPLRYRCNSGCGADHVIQVPRKMRAVDMTVWISQVQTRIGAHHGTNHPACPSKASGGTVDTLFPVEGQDEEALRNMHWPTLEEMQGRMRDVE